MKRLVEEVPANETGLLGLLGEEVVLMGRFFYKGKLKGVNETFVELANAEIIYDTDKNGTITNVGKVPTANGQWFVQTTAIESWGKAGK